MPFLTKTLPNNKWVAITNGEIVLPIDTVEDLDDYERDLSCLYEPFPALVKVYKGEMLAQN